MNWYNCSLHLAVFTTFMSVAEKKRVYVGQSSNKCKSVVKEHTKGVIVGFYS